MSRQSHPHFLTSLLIAGALALALASVASPEGHEGRAAAAGLNAPKPPIGNGKRSTATPTTTAAAPAVPAAPETATPTPTLQATTTATPTTATVVPAVPVDTATATATLAPRATATATAPPTFTPTATATSPPTLTSTPTAVPTLPTATPTATSTPVQSALSNDDIGSARLITAFPFSASQDTTRATVASDDPDVGIGTDANSHTVWYYFVAPSSGSVQADTFGSDYDTVLAAFTGSRGDLALVAGNDDFSSGRQSQIGFNVQGGTTYYLEIADYGNSGAGGQLRLAVEFSTAALEPTPTVTPIPTWSPTMTRTPTPIVSSTPPGNDDFGSAIEIGSLPFTATIETSGATVASDDPVMGNSTSVNSNTVWYRLMAATSGSVEANTFGSSYDTVLAVFTGSRGSLTLVVSNDDAGSSRQSQVRFGAQPGVTYYLEVAQYGASGGGELHLSVESSSLALARTSSATPTGTPAPSALGTGATGSPTPGETARSVTRDVRYFPQTGYRVNLDAFWDFFQKRGGVEAFGYPISWDFTLMGFRVQMFQRGILQRMPDGSVAAMNLLDGGMMPYTHINFSTFPAQDRELLQNAPSPSDPDFAEKALAFLQAEVPDRWEGLPVGFLRTYASTVRYEDAFPQGDGEAALVPLMNLELWGLPTSRPAYDPNNHNFVYQRFQRGIMHFDLSTGATQGLLLADYLKSIMTGDGLPIDLDLEARESPFYRQYDRAGRDYLARPQRLPGTNLEAAFERARP